jgi:hypothetical protein
MDASVRPDDDAFPFTSTDPSETAHAFIVSPNGDCALPARLQAQADRIRTIRKEMVAREGAIKAAEDKLRSKVGLLSNSVTSGPAQRTMRCMEPSRLMTRTS